MAFVYSGFADEEGVSATWVSTNSASAPAPPRGRRAELPPLQGVVVPFKVERGSQLRFGATSLVESLRAPLQIPAGAFAIIDHPTGPVKLMTKLLTVTHLGPEVPGTFRRIDCDVETKHQTLELVEGQTRFVEMHPDSGWRVMDEAAARQHMMTGGGKLPGWFTDDVLNGQYYHWSWVYRQGTPTGALRTTREW